jgi:hypothetical protein
MIIDLQEIKKRLSLQEVEHYGKMEDQLNTLRAIASVIKKYTDGKILGPTSADDETICELVLNP